MAASSSWSCRLALKQATPNSCRQTSAAAISACGSSVATRRPSGRSRGRSVVHTRKRTDTTETPQHRPFNVAHEDQKHMPIHQSARWPGAPARRFRKAVHWRPRRRLRWAWALTWWPGKAARCHARRRPPWIRAARNARSASCHNWWAR